MVQSLGWSLVSQPDNGETVNSVTGPKFKKGEVATATELASNQCHGCLIHSKASKKLNGEDDHTLWYEDRRDRQGAGSLEPLPNTPSNTQNGSRLRVG